MTIVILLMGLYISKTTPTLQCAKADADKSKNMRHNTCTGRFLSQPQGTMHNGYYVEREYNVSSIIKGTAGLTLP